MKTQSKEPMSLRDCLMSLIRAQRVATESTWEMIEIVAELALSQSSVASLDVAVPSAPTAPVERTPTEELPAAEPTITDAYPVGMKAGDIPKPVAEDLTPQSLKAMSPEKLREILAEGEKEAAREREEDRMQAIINAKAAEDLPSPELTPEKCMEMLAEVDREIAEKASASESPSESFDHTPPATLLGEGLTARDFRIGKDGKVHPLVLKVLSEVEINSKENRVKITTGQLARPLYLAVNEILSDLGGAWRKSTKTHVFDRNPSEEIAHVIKTGTFVTDKAMGFFPTPEPVIDEIMKVADLDVTHEVLEPSAGMGHIVRALIKRGCNVTCVEQEPRRAIVLKEYGYTVHQADFLRWGSPERFDRIIMNPPFTNGIDTDHVMRAYEYLKPGGRLVSVMSAAVQTRQDRDTAALRLLVKKSGKFIELPEGSFAESGTMISTVLCVLSKENA